MVIAYIIGGLVGMAIGAFIQRFIIYLAVDNVPPSICDYCHWKKENQWQWDRRRDRHRK